jgi:hypothetical protein
MKFMFERLIVAICFPFVDKNGKTTSGTRCFVYGSPGGNQHQHGVGLFLHDVTSTDTLLPS